MDTWHDVGHTSNLNLSWDKRGIGAKRAKFLGFDRERDRGEERRERGEPNLPPKIYRVSLVDFRRAKNKSYHIDKGYAWVLGKRDYIEDSRGEILGNRSCRV